MAENNNSPSRINYSSRAEGALITDSPKKRKFEEDKLEPPLPNHKNFERILGNSGRDTSLKQEFETCMITEDAESARDSNSFVADYDPSESEPEFSTTSVRDQPSTTSSDWGSSSFESTLYSLDSRIVTNRGHGKEVATAMVLGQSPHHGNVQFEDYPDLDDQLRALEGLVDYSYAEYSNKYTGKEDTEEMMPSSSGTNQNVYVLSSGRWSVNPEPLQDTKKPTIDQEFEEYFSSLVL